MLTNTVEELAEKELVKSKLVFDYKVPLKGGASKHYILSWFAVNMEDNVENLNTIRKTVYDSPLSYIDNTKDSIDFYKTLK